MYETVLSRTNGIEEDNNNYSLIAHFSETELRNIIGKSFNVYVIANYTAPGRYSTEDDFLNSTVSFSNLGVSPLTEFGENKGGSLCPMANEAVFRVDDLKDVEIPSDLTYQELRTLIADLFKDNYADGKLWKLQRVLPLERQVARIDFKDVNNNNWIYKLNGAKSNASGTTSTDVYLKIISLQLFNVGKEEYTFRHIQPLSINNEDPHGLLQPFGVEKGNISGLYNWIADSDWEKKKTATFSFFNQMFSSSNDLGKITWNFTPSNIQDAYITTAALKNWLNKNNKRGDDYASWYYITENTVSSTEMMTLKYSTGISFKLLVCDVQGNPLKIDGNKNMIITMSDGDYQTLVKQASIKDPDDDTKILEPEGYYLTYRYLIEHNAVKGASKSPMEIAVVRNNIYRIHVKSISHLPDPDFGMEVYSYVIPWELRTDDDIFLK